MIAAIVTRQAFADNRMLSMNADLRAIREIFKNADKDLDRFTAEKHTPTKYGWPMVEVNDYV